MFAFIDEWICEIGWLLNGELQVWRVMVAAGAIKVPPPTARSPVVHCPSHLS